MRNFKSAISRRLSPLEKTALVAGSNSTHDGEGLSEDEIYEELLSRQVGKRIEFPEGDGRSPNLKDIRKETGDITQFGERAKHQAFSLKKQLEKKNRDVMDRKVKGKQKLENAMFRKRQRKQEMRRENG